MANYRRVARRAAARHGLDPRLFERQIGAESNFDPGAVSPAGARGIAQIMPATARGWGVNPDDPHQALDAAARNMAQYVRQFGSYEKALRAYNAGPGNVERSRGFTETNAYVRKILGGGAGGSQQRAAAAPRLRLGLGTPATVSISRRSVFDQAGYQQAQQRARVATFLRSQGRGNSILFRSGLLSADAPNPQDFTTSRLRSTLTPATAGVLGSVGGGVPSGQAHAAVRAARQKLGIAEIGSSNRGREVDQMQRSFGMVGQPWCGIFLGTVLRQAGVKGVDSRIASVNAIEQMARSGQGAFERFAGARHAQRGDALITAKGQHVVFVTGRSGNVIHTIGGNSGGRVQRVDYRADQVYGVAKVRYRR